MEAANRQGEDLGLTDDEVVFYDILAQNESAVKAMGNDELNVIAAELVTNVRKSVTIDWTVRESACAKIRVMVRRMLNKHGLPAGSARGGNEASAEQAQLLCAEWAST
jgi:type I restriction enzyme R subunit